MKILVFYMMTVLLKASTHKNELSIKRHNHSVNSTKRLREYYFKKFTLENFKPKLYNAIPTPDFQNGRYTRKFRFPRILLNPMRNRRKYLRKAFKNFEHKAVLPKPETRRHLSTPLSKYKRQKIMRTLARRQMEGNEYQGPRTRPTNVPPYMRQRPQHKRKTEKKENLRIMRTAPLRQTFEEQCDYHIEYCLRAYNTGIICGRTMYMTYHTFTNYCSLDYVNCMERYEVWMHAHPGPCFNITTREYVVHYNYSDDYFLDGNVAKPIF